MNESNQENNQDLLFDDLLNEVDFVFDKIN